jgi:hypothetical protein
MADEGIKDDKDEVEGHKAMLTDDPSDSETSDDVEGHIKAKAIGEPVDSRPSKAPLNSADEDDVEGHRTHA